MLNCKTSKDCFYGGKRYRKGDSVNFDGAKKDLPDYLTEIKTEVKEKKAKPE